MKKALKWTGIILLAVLLVIQFVPKPAKNLEASIPDTHISKFVSIPAGVHEILKEACMDCHSNHTRYPWYSRLQPVAWWMGDHVAEGKKELNFSEFGSYSTKKQQKKWEEIAKEVRKKKMPIKSYTYTHSGARLNESEREILASWAESHLAER